MAEHVHEGDKCKTVLNYWRDGDAKQITSWLNMSKRGIRAKVVSITGGMVPCGELIGRAGIGFCRIITICSRRLRIERKNQFRLRNVQKNQSRPRIAEKNQFKTKRAPNSDPGGQEGLGFLNWDGDKKDQTSGARCPRLGHLAHLHADPK